MLALPSSQRHLFFTGKGGVGKTSIACATAVALADQGRRVLLVSTDPASNLDEVLGTSLGSHPTEVNTVPRLRAMNIDPEQAAREYRERMVAPYRGVLPDAAIQSMEEQFSGSCTLEIAAFDEFAKLLGDTSTTAEYDHIVFDTAPTGHTLRLLTLPSAWAGFMDTNISGTSCLGPLAGLEPQHAIYKSAVQTLSDALQTTLVLVTRPERSALREAERTSRELRELGMENQQLVINGVFQAQDQTDEIALAMQRRGDQALDDLPGEIRQLEPIKVPLMPAGLVGVDALRMLFSDTDSSSPLSSQSTSTAEVPEGTIDLHALVEQLADQQHGVVLTMGKGGVGKTMVAAAVAVALAERGFPVHLSTTDPAAHLASTLAAEELPRLTVSRIDPAEVTASYRDSVMRTAGAQLDGPGKALLEEDLRSPCTEEIAVFRAFAEAVAGGEKGFVVLDTAPTGHTVLLLDAALAYHREVSRQVNQMPPSVEQLLPRLRDPQYTRVLVVTLPESTPVHEAAKLQDDLRRAEIEPFAWVINQTLTTLPVRDPVLLQRQRAERRFIEEVRDQHARATSSPTVRTSSEHRPSSTAEPPSESLPKHTVLIPWQVEPPVGVSRLRQLSAITPLSQSSN